MTIIDRFEGEYAVLETDSGMKTVPRDMLPDGACEGDVLEVTDGAYTINKKAAEKRRREIREKLRKLQHNKEN
ncbi:DUF3006 domain-containing protein [Ruminococcus sp.]|uniref:DUF3006 domain-containing protein n=1 Tax=Ruminococcus sp. TaxID=41978 RepID=UPI0025FA713F|nr:DUF3006 domain-containing protein [Ruminococcus sp.]MCR4637700.1 DUF3006 domain-containing protein [Ruminococcus sp.]